MICKVCGNNIMEGERCCDLCGEPIDDELKPKPAADPESEEKKTADPFWEAPPSDEDALIPESAQKPDDPYHDMPDAAQGSAPESKADAIYDFHIADRDNNTDKNTLLTKGIAAVSIAIFCIVVILIFTR